MVRSGLVHPWLRVERDRQKKRSCWTVRSGLVHPWAKVGRDRQKNEAGGDE